jgi:hypothetical protein
MVGFFYYITEGVIGDIGAVVTSAKLPVVMCLDLNPHTLSL